MYVLDPTSGKRRRSILSDKLFHFSKVAARSLDTTGRDISHRVQGVVAESRRVFESDDVSEDVLIERVRSAIGRAVSHPSSIEVSAKDGRIILSGPVLKEEHNRLLDRARKVRGVRFVDDRLQPQKERGGEPGLRGGTGRLERSRSKH